MKFLFARFAYIAVALLIIGYALVALRGPHGIPGLIEKRKEIHELEQRNANLAREIEQKRDRVSRLRESEAAQDLEIRERLKLVKPGEKVFVLQDSNRK